MNAPFRIQSSDAAATPPRVLIIGVGIGGKVFLDDNRAWLAPFGALTAASRMRWMSASGIGSGRNRRIERWVKITSPSGIDNRV